MTYGNPTRTLRSLHHKSQNSSDAPTSPPAVTPNLSRTPVLLLDDGGAALDVADGLGPEEPDVAAAVAEADDGDGAAVAVTSLVTVWLAKQGSQDDSALANRARPSWCGSAPETLKPL